MPLKVLFDGMVYDALERDTASRDALKALIACGKVEVLMPRVVQDEVAARPGGLPDWLTFSRIPDGACVPGISIVGAARVGGGRVFMPHLGNSRNKGKDAVIAATADLDADLFVSDDRRCRERAKLYTRCECLSYTEFVRRLASL